MLDSQNNHDLDETSSCNCHNCIAPPASQSSLNVRSNHAKWIFQKMVKVSYAFFPQKWTNLHTQFLKFLLPPFLWVLNCSKKNLRKWTWKQENMTKILVFQPILNCFTILESLEKYLFIKLIVSSINRSFVNFLSIFMVLARKGC
jgi:hypothetical protein